MYELRKSCICGTESQNEKQMILGKSTTMKREFSHHSPSPHQGVER